MGNAFLNLLPSLFVLSISVAIAQEPAVTLSDDKQSVIVQGIDEEPRSFDVIGACGIPTVGESEIRSYKVEGSRISVAFGKHCAADIDLSTGAIQCLGCD